MLEVPSPKVHELVPLLLVDVLVNVTVLPLMSTVNDALAGEASETVAVAETAGEQIPLCTFTLNRVADFIPV